MPTPHFRSQLAAAVLGLLGTAFLVNSLSVHPQDKGDKASATQSKESSSGSSSGASTTQGGAAGAGKLSQTDERMIKQIAEANLAEISAGKLAQDKAQSDEVKSFAKKMVDDHTKALDDLKQPAQSKGVTLPTDKETHRLLQRAASRAEDTDLKNYASKAIGTVETHQQMAKETTRNLKATSEGKSGPGKESSGGGSKGTEESSGGASSGEGKSMTDSTGESK